MSKRYGFPLPGVIHELLKDEERAANIVIGGAAVVGAVAFTAAVLAMLLMH